MKKTSLYICSLVCLVILTAAVSASAQTQYRMHIPFDFNIGQLGFAAGDYSVSLLSQASDKKLILIRDAKGRSSYTVMPTGTDSNSKIDLTNLVFNRYENQYFLAIISTPNFKAELSKSKLEEKIAKSLKAKREMLAMKKEN
jgi:hypothetical protein